MTFVLPDLRELEYPQFGPEGGLVGAWSPALSGATGSTLYDLSGRRNHGTLTNMDPATDWVIQNGYTALDFDASNDLVTAPLSAAGKIKQSFVAWMWRSATSVTNGCGFAPLANDRLSFIAFSDANLYASAENGTANYHVYNSIPGVGMHMIACVFDGSQATNATRLKTYVDGIYVAPSGTDGTIPTSLGSATPFDLGRDTVGRPTGGRTMEAIVFDRVLHDRDIAHLYSLGPGGWAIPRQRRWNALGAAAASFQAAWAANINRVITPGTV